LHLDCANKNSTVDIKKISKLCHLVHTPETGNLNQKLTRNPISEARHKEKPEAIQQAKQKAFYHFAKDYLTSTAKSHQAILARNHLACPTRSCRKMMKTTFNQEASAARKC
jgi:hypothetical protein